MKTCCSVLAAVLIFFQPLGAQTLTIQNGANFFVAAGALVSIDSLILQPSADFNMTGPNALTRHALVSYPSANPYISRVYRWQAPLSSFTGTINFYYRQEELNGLAENALTLNVHNGTGWTAYTTGVVRDGNANLVSTTGLTGIGLRELTLASQSAALPLRWLGLKAKAIGPVNEVSWETTNEEGTKDFQLQKSRDALIWTNEGVAISARNTPGTHSYTHTDVQPYLPLTYYRILQRDLNGQVDFSPVVPVKRTAAAALLLSPNPAFDHIRLNAGLDLIGSVAVFDAGGRKVFEQRQLHQSVLTIPVAHWAKGHYTVRLTINQQVVFASFIKN